MPFDPTLNEELQKSGSEPLLPVEKRLIGWSLGLGLTFLIILGVIARTLSTT